MENTALIRLVNNELNLEIPEKLSYDELHGQLATHINGLIKNDFDKLISYLYRIDVSEEKLKSLLQQNHQEDAGDIIAALVIERQVQKIKTRQHFRKRDQDVDEAEKW